MLDMLDVLYMLDILDRKCETITVAPNSDGNGRQILQQVEYKYKEMFGEKYSWPS